MDEAWGGWVLFPASSWEQVEKGKCKGRVDEANSNGLNNGIFEMGYGLVELTGWRGCGRMGRRCRWYEFIMHTSRNGGGGACKRVKGGDNGFLIYRNGWVR